jgi:hypothetical protein
MLSVRLVILLHIYYWQMIYIPKFVIPVLLLRSVQGSRNLRYEFFEITFVKMSVRDTRTSLSLKLIALYLFRRRFNNLPKRILPGDFTITKFPKIAASHFHTNL